ncbi:MAG: NAD(P)-dependent oxidoreductase [Alphaproteobacteria bacterium]|nr:NAD(P)-dependent oxidoreductase [Alphaproteobacteria bacterium]MCZ6589012.1 NAD(P)-dependent oxidoreductase [Alphaproteobacteria bacterium]MCZ6591069.1 NAD(P)-dependent oxidoreductase [Alphaproteobacteria bacterium]
MATENLNSHTIGWIGTGKMGYPMAARLIAAGVDVTVYNRTKAKAEPLGVTVVDTPADLADRDIVYTIVTDDTALREMVIGPNGVLSGDASPQILLDSSTVSPETSDEIRAAANAKGTQFLAVPITGNGHAVKAGKSTLGVSGPRDAYDLVEPYLEQIGSGVTYLGEGDAGRIAKLAHNVMLAVVAQNLAEITVFAERGGVARHAFLDFLNKSVMGSVFTTYKTPALVNLDFTATHTCKMLRKDMELALATARKLEVPMPVTSLTRDILQSLIGLGYGDADFAALIEVQAKASGYEIQPENIAVSDGLQEAAE